MLAKTLSCAVLGLEGALVEVEVDIAPGLPSFSIVGLPDTAIQEARDRVRAAIRNSGGTFPLRRITVNLAPADLRKGSTAYDLPVAFAILVASEQVPAQGAEEALFLGELSLDGTLRSTRGILPMVAVAKEKGLRTVYVPATNAQEAALVEGMSIYPVPSLSALMAHWLGHEPLPLYQSTPQLTQAAAPSSRSDMSVIKGQEHAKRAVEIAAAGGHNLLLTGPPGAGKTLLARTLPTILPSLSPEETLEVTKIYSISGLLPVENLLVTERPFRAPHYTISTAGLVGGGRWPRPGELTLSHRGVLFLDELPEFGPTALEALRQPLEDRTVTISRAQGSLTFPANFMLVGAMNSCPCGYYGDLVRECTCTSSAIARYHQRLSGPLLDRFDLFVEVPRVDYEKLTDDRLAEPSSTIRARVTAARQRQRSRLAEAGLFCNAEMSPDEVRRHCLLEESAQELLRAAMRQFALTARGFHRVLKVARTIADCASSERITVGQLAEALQYRARIPLARGA